MGEAYIPGIDPFHKEEDYVIYEREGGGFTVALTKSGRTYRCSKLENVVSWLVRQGLA